MKPTVVSGNEWPSNVKPHTITFVRHGEKNGGGFSADLTERGRSSAVTAGSRIACNVDLFISSPSPRTVSTALCIREGNGSSAPLVQEDHLAEPGLGYYAEYRSAMRAFIMRILDIVKENHAEIVVATTHNYVIGYIANLPGCRMGELDYLSGITINLEILQQIVEML